MLVVAFGGARGSFRRRGTSPVVSAASADVADEARLLDEAIPDLDWRAFPPGTERTGFAAPSGDLARVALGPADGPRVVLVPGATGSKEDFVLMMPLFAAAGYRVESYDLAGHYESWAAGPWNLDPPRARYDERLFLDDLLAVLDDGAPRAHVLGYSFAATLAELALLAQAGPLREPHPVSAPPEPGQAFRGVKRIGPISDLTSPRQGAALMLWGSATTSTGCPRAARVRAGAVRAHPPRERRRHHRAHDADARRRTELLAAPVPKLVAVGEHDLWPRELHERFAREIGARFAVYPTGHSPCETAPHQLVRDMLALFDEAGVTP